MYRPKKLTKAQFDELKDTLRSSHAYTVAAELRNLDGKTVRDLTNMISDGQVDMKGHGRSATLTLNDPQRTLHDVEGKRAAHYLAAASYVVSGLSWGSESVPVGVGRLDTCSRSGPTVTMTWRGKGVMFDHALGHPLTIKAGVAKTEAMRRIMAAVGESRSLMDIADRPATLAHDLVLSATDKGWGQASRLADEMNMLLFYDGDGRLQGRGWPDTPAVTMRTGFHDRPAWLTSEPVKSTDARRIVNREIFHYKDKKTDPVVVELPRSDELSAYSLARNGVPQWYVDVHHAFSVNSKTHAESLAKQRLRRFQQAVVHVQAECFPFPFLEPGDLVRFESRDYTGVTTLGSWSLPLSPGQAMTLGWTDVRTNW